MCAQMMTALRQHNATVRRDKLSAEARRRRFMRRHLNLLSPFLEDSVVASLAHEVTDVREVSRERGGSTTWHLEGRTLMRSVWLYNCR
jgi:hypothetical protein